MKSVLSIGMSACLLTAGLAVSGFLSGCNVQPTSVSGTYREHADGSRSYGVDIRLGPVEGRTPLPGDENNHLLSPPADPPIGIVHVGTVIEGKLLVDVFNDPATGSQWVQDSDGDYHLVVSGEYLFGGENNATADGGVLVANSVLQYQADIDFSFNQEADTASVDFLLSHEMANLYVGEIDLPFLVHEDVQILQNGDFQISYTGTINDVVGSMGWLGIASIEFKDSIAGMVEVNWSRNSNVVTIDTTIGTETMIIEFTNPNNLP